MPIQKAVFMTAARSCCKNGLRPTFFKIVVLKYTKTLILRIESAFVIRTLLPGSYAPHVLLNSQHQERDPQPPSKFIPRAIPEDIQRVELRICRAFEIDDVQDLLLDVLYRFRVDRQIMQSSQDFVAFVFAAAFVVPSTSIVSVCEW